MPSEYKRRIYLYINGQEVENNVKKIRDEMRKLINEQARMTIGSKEYVDAGKKISLMRGILNDHNRSLRETAGVWGTLKKAADGFNKYIGLAASFVAGMAGMGMGFKSAVESANLFEERLGNLSALTGLSGKELEWLGNTAKDTSVKITDSGVRIKQSASDIVDAYMKMGSARPELLKNKEALAQVTEQAIILAEAGKIELQQAIDAVAASMNQFNLDASQSERIINAIAAGSLEGSSEIVDLTESMKNVGTVAAHSNMSLEQTVAALEVLGEKQLKGAEAGTKLRGVLLKMKEAGVGYASGQFNISDAIAEVNAKLAAQTTQLEQDALKQKVFGTENITAGMILLQNVEKYDKLTTAVTGTNVAIEQAAKNTNNNNAQLQQAKNKLELISMELGQKLAPAQIFATKSLTGFIDMIMKAPQWIIRNQALLIVLTGSILAYNSKLLIQLALKAKERALWLEDIILRKTSIIWMNAQTAAIRMQIAITGQATLAQQAMVRETVAMNAALKLNPIGWVIAGLTAAVAAIKLYDSHNKESIRLELEKGKAIEDLAKTQNALEDSYKLLDEQITNINTLSVQEKKDLQDKINKTIELAEAELTLAEAKQLQIQKDNTRASLWQMVVNQVKTGGIISSGAAENMKDAIDNGLKAAENLNPALEKIRESLNKLKGQKFSIDDILNSESIGDSIQTETIADLEAKMQRYQTALRNVVVNGEEYLRIRKKIVAVELELSKAKADDTGNRGGNNVVDNKKKEEDEITKAIDGAYKDRILDLKRQYAEQLIVKEDFDDQMIIEEMAYLENVILLRLKAGQDISEQQTRFYDLLIQQHADELKLQQEIDKDVQDRIAAEDKALKEKIEKERLARDLKKEGEDSAREKAIQAEKDLYEKKLKITEAYHNAALSSIEVIQMFQQAAMKKELAAAGDNTKKREEIEKKYRQKQKIWAIAQALIEGSLEIARINSNAGVNADLTQTLRIILTGLAVARTAGTIATISSQQFAKGKYPVMGQETGRIYQSALVGPVRTGLYSRPSLGLFAEHEPEIVIDGPTTRNIQANYPGILRAIYQMKKYPQYSKGLYSDIVEPGVFQNTSDIAIVGLVNATKESLDLLNQQLRYQSKFGIPAYLKYQDIKSADNDVSDIINKTTIR